MEKIYKGIIILLTAFLVIAFIYIGNRSKGIADSENELILLVEEIINKDIVIKEQSEEIKVKENELQTILDKLEEKDNLIEKLSKEETSLANKINAYEKLVDELNNSIEIIHSEIETRMFYNNISIDFDLSEDRAIELFGEPMEENIEIYGSDDFWYLEGIYSKESVYKNFILNYHGDTNGENYELVAYSSISSESYIDNDVRVSDTLEELLEAFPMLEEDTWRTEGKGFMYQDMVGMTGVYFEIEEEKISKISVYHILD